MAVGIDSSVWQAIALALGAPKPQMAHNRTMALEEHQAFWRLSRDFHLLPCCSLKLCLFHPHAASLHRCLHTLQQGCSPSAALHEPLRASRMVTRERDTGSDHHLQNQIPSVRPAACRPTLLLPPLHQQHPHQWLLFYGWAERDRLNSIPPLLLLPVQAWFCTEETENGI